MENVTFTGIDFQEVFDDNNRVATKKVSGTKIDPSGKERALRVAYNLKRIRRERGIKTVNDLIEMMTRVEIEINPSYMRRLESANAPFGSDMEQRFMQFYKVDVSEFYRPEVLTDKEKEIDAIRGMLIQLDIEKLKRLKGLIPVLFGGINAAAEEISKDTPISDEEKSA